MTSTQLIQSIENCLKRLDGNPLVKEWLKLFATSSREIPDKVTAAVAAQDGTTILNTINHTQNVIRTAVGTFKKSMKPTQIARAIDELEQTIGDFFGEVEGGRKSSEYKSLIEAFRNSYDEYVHDYGYVSTIKLCLAADVLYNALRFDRETLQNVRDALIPTDREGDASRRRLSIYFADDLSLEQMAEKLLMLDQMYKNICRTLNINLDERPLEVVKIESGSPLSIAVAGWPAAIVLIVWITYTASKFYFNEVSNLGLNRIRREEEVAKMSAALLEKARELHIDDPGMELRVKETFNQLSENSFIFVKSRGGLTIDGTRFGPQGGSPNTLPHHDRKLLPGNQQ